MNKPDLSDSGLPKSGRANSNFVKQTISFVEDFTAFAGLDGVWAAALAVIAAAFDGIGLLLLVPLLSIITAADAGAGWTHRFIVQGFDLFGAQTRSARLSVLLGLFTVLVVVRAILIARRNMMLAQLEAGFVEAVAAIRAWTAWQSHRSAYI
jgi:ATP-binding cassette, subfamily C, bacterial